MGGESQPGPGVSAGAGDGEPTQTFAGQGPVTEAAPAGPASAPRHPPTEAAAPHSQTEDRPPRAMQAAPLRLPTDVVRYGPGVPATPATDQAGVSAEWVWRTGHPPTSRAGSRRLRQMLGPALTVVLLAASGIVLYLRFHHAPFHVTGVTISQHTRTGCGVNVTGLITTNGAAGTVAYQWLILPERQAPQPLNQSVTAGQRVVYVTVAIGVSGHGSASRTVILQVLGPDSGHASVPVVLRC